MNRFDLNTVIEEAGIDKKKLAMVLFPKNDHPVSALRRVLKGETELGVSQLYILSDYLGIDVPTLMAPKWKASASKTGMEFRNGPYTARITQNFCVALYKDDELIEEFLIRTSCMTLTEFIDILTTKTKQHKNGKL